MQTKRAQALRALPSIDRLLRHPATETLLGRFSRAAVTTTLRQLLDEIRVAGFARGDGEATTEAALIERAGEMLRCADAPSLRPVINASGIVLHTNLGRALLAESAARAVTAVATRPCNLEYDLEAGERGERDAHVESLLCALTGAEAALAVNNNAAAVLLALNTLAEGREVIVSRGELVEIGGSFRIPDILAKSGAILREVGTTNRTHRRDYALAIGVQTALLLKVHPSNYRIEGFTAEATLADLAGLGREHTLPVMEDLGSGALIDFTPHGLAYEPVVSERIGVGVDVVTFSGDKLLGGPQAGLIVGRRALVERMRRNPLKRALRCDKMTLAALEATLRLYRNSPDLATELPTLRALTRPFAEMDELGRAALPLLREKLGSDYEILLTDSTSRFGSGSLPDESLPTRAISICHSRIGPLEIAAHFRAGDPAVIGRVHQDRFWLDLRCVWEAEDLVRGLRSPARSENVSHSKSS